MNENYELWYEKCRSEYAIYCKTSCCYVLFGTDREEIETKVKELNKIKN